MINLKVRTEYSFGKTYAPLGRVITRLKELGCTAAAIVDDDTWGHVRWFNSCRDAGIQPLLGCTAIVTDAEDRIPRMWFIAKNTEGLSELYQALSKSYHQKVPTAKGNRPRLYTTDVIGMSSNIFKFAGDVVDEELWVKLAKGSLEGAQLPSFFIDITENGSKLTNRRKQSLAEKLGLGARLVGVWDNAYAYPEDKELLEYMPFGTSSERDLSLPSKLSIGLDNAKSIADACSSLELPKAPMISMQGDIEALCRAAIPERFPNGWTEEYEERLQHELEEIRAKDFSSYFLLVQDMVKYAKKHMLVGPSRGSSAGSLVCYLLHITEIDPIPPGLYFERFIDKTRKDLPDIDIDFPDNKREMVIEYLKTKWGVEHVAHVGNIAMFKPKSALIQVCKRLGIPSSATAAVKVAIIERGKADARAQLCLLDTLQGTDAGKKFLSMYPQAGVAAKLEGHSVRTGVHAAGVLVCNEPINRYCVVDDEDIAHIDKRNIEQVNLLKMDILGLRTLTVLEDCRVPNIDWYHLPLNDPKAYGIFNSGRLSGIFQFEGNALRSLTSKLKFKSIREIDAVTALARPGPFNTGISNVWIERHNGQPYKSIHPLMAKLLHDSYELPLYQENTMAIVREIGKFSWEQTAYVRHAISKVQGDTALKSLTETFFKGAKTNGLDDATAHAIWDQINAMGAWQMNKSHTYSYATISYWTAWLKANYPLQFAASTLRHAKDDDSAIELLREFVREGYSYTWFDPSKSDIDWAVKDGELLGGFKVIIGVGDAAAAKYVTQRDNGSLAKSTIDKLLAKGSPFRDVFHITHKYSDYYDGKMRVRGKVYKIADIPEGLPNQTERVFIGELIFKNQRDLNEDMLIKKRHGQVIPAGKPTKFLDVRLRDDSGMIGGRVAVHLYERLGKPIVENIELGKILLIRAKFFHGIRYAFISKWQVLE